MDAFNRIGIAIFDALTRVGWINPADDRVTTFWRGVVIALLVAWIFDRLRVQFWAELLIAVAVAIWAENQPVATSPGPQVWENVR